MDESINDEPLVITGLFCDMFSPDFSITTEKVLLSNDKTMLFDLKLAKNYDIIGTSVRIDSIETETNRVILNISGAKMRKANIRIKLPFKPATASIDGNKAELSFDKLSSTALISFPNVTGNRKIVIE